MKAERINVERKETERMNIEQIRSDFPILGLQVSGKPLVYLDNAASSQMPTFTAQCIT
jgi:cysteine desulfurase/selenocysteine lyase